MKNKIPAAVALLFSTLFLSQQTQAHSSTFNYETYLESWDSQWQTALENLPPGPGGTSATSYQNVTLNISFAAYVFTGDILNGVQFSIADVGTVVDFVHSHGGKVKIAFGGASTAPPFAPYYYISQTVGWPGNINDLATGVANVVNTYNFDGVDFDIEDPQPSGVSIDAFATQLLSFLQLVRTAIPDKTISLTIPAQGWGTYWQPLAEGAASQNLVDCINFMEYDIWINPSLTGYAQQIAADILTYTSPTNESPAPNWSPGWGIPAHLIQVGLMPGDDDQAHELTVEDAQTVSQSVVNQSLYGAMTWDINRDAGTDPHPPITTPPYAYSEAIRAILDAAQPSQKYHIHRKPSIRIRPSQNEFERQPPPPHGSPS